MNEHIEIEKNDDCPIEGHVWQYWHGGDERPEKLPEGCEFYDAEDGVWWAAKDDPTRWTSPRRWPVPEWQAKAEAWIYAYGASIPEGWEVMGFGEFSEEPEVRLLGNGKAMCGASKASSLLVHIREKEPEYTYIYQPTQEQLIEYIWDHKDYPEVDFKAQSGDAWIPGILVCVRVPGSWFMDRDGNEYGECRMKVKVKK